MCSMGPVILDTRYCYGHGSSIISSGAVHISKLIIIFAAMLSNFALAAQ
jgi:hypothetical protein